MECSSHQQTISVAAGDDQLDLRPPANGAGLLLVGEEEPSTCLNEASHQCRCKDDKWVWPRFGVSDLLFCGLLADCFECV